MKNKIEQFIFHHHDTFKNFAGFLTISLFFASGIGRYRYVLVYAVYYLITSFLSFNKSFSKSGRKIRCLFAPATFIALYWDVIDGPYFPIFEINSLLITLPTMLIIDQLVSDYACSIIARVSNYQVFRRCPKCRHKHVYLVSQCSNCNYKEGEKWIRPGEECGAGLKQDAQIDVTTRE